ncbi:MAG: hypothetical protein JW981_05710 [Anaerolineae bacterium]|nr:hypothetical protein [Anaerolineae bacterium]
MSRVITFTGPSGSGKSTAIQHILELSQADVTFKPLLVAKYTTRHGRLDDRGEVMCVDSIPGECDVIYEHCEKLYGLELRNLSDAIALGKTPLVILNDVRTLEYVQRSLKGLVKSIFIFREEPSLQKYRQLAQSRGVVDEQEPVRRFLKARAFYRIYSENIYLFDHVILNTGTIGDLKAQMAQVIKGTKLSPRTHVHQEGDLVFLQRLFVVVGTPGSGKDFLIRAVHELGFHQVQIVPKHTSRDRRPSDGDEMICPGDPGYNLSGCDIIYENYGDYYGIDFDKVWRGLRQGVFQVVVVSNIEALDRLREVFGQLMVLVYVHSGMDANEYRDAELVYGGDANYVERRAEQYRLAFDVYLQNYLAFHHVLINSGVPEDLLDQLFRLIRAYERGVFGNTLSRSLVPERIWMQMSLGK